MLHSKTKVLSIHEIKREIKGEVICATMFLSLFSIAALLALRADGVMKVIGTFLRVPGVGSLWMVCCNVYKIFERMWIIRTIHRGSNPYSESQVHLRLGIQNVVLACLTLTGMVLLFVLLRKYDLLFFSIPIGIVLCMLVKFFGKEALQMFRDAGRFEERERIEREITYMANSPKFIKEGRKDANLEKR